ncbi:copper resistance protein CopC [Ornithinimicrobium sp. LYQ92]|uniref:copper resistance CopC family protein n=1 Tax=Serinicoccus sp. LYQ92 TaxID=3378798 RepID=UPI003854148C
MTRLPRIPLALLLTGALVLAPGAAQAHDELTGSEPVDGATAEAPEEVTLTYSGQIATVGATVQVTDEDGQEVTDGDPEVEGTSVVQDLVDDLPDGEYAVAWRVTSEDGHPISGEFGFAVTGSQEQATEEETSAEESSAPAPTEETGAAETTEPEPTTAEATEEETEDAGRETTTEGTSEATDAATEASTDSDSGGLPFWAWAFIAAAVLGLGAALAMSWSRARR